MPTEFVRSANCFCSATTLYGTAEGGGESGNGTVFNLSFRPQMTITPSWDEHHSVMADQLGWIRLHWLYFAIHHEPCSAGLDHQSSGTGRRQRAEYCDQPNLQSTAVLPAGRTLI